MLPTIGLEKTMNVNKCVNKVGHSRSFLAHFLVFCLLALLPVLPAFATNYTWDGGAGPANDKWSQANNWGIPDANNVAPPQNSVAGLTNIDIFFSGNIRLIPKVDQTYFIRSMTFNSGAGAFSITPQNTEILRIGAGGIVNNSTNIQTVAISLSLSNSQTWNASAGHLFFSESVNLNASTLTLAGLFNIGISNTISGTGALVKNDSGALALAGTAPNTFSGGLTVNNGTVTAQKANAFGSGAVTVNAGTLNTVTHNQNVGTVTLNGGVIGGSTGIITGSTYQVRSGAINARLGGSAGMTKTTAGTVTLTSSNIYTGGTTINGGKLVVNNTSGSGTGSGNVTNNSSGVLGGIGTITGNVYLMPGSKITAGDDNIVGKLTTGSQTWSGGVTNLVNVRSVSAGEGSGHDFLSISGGLTITATTANKLFIDIRSLTLANSPGLVGDFDSSQSYIWTIARTVSGITFAPGESESTVFSLLMGGFVNSLDGGTLSLATGNAGKDLNLVFTPAAVPEPTVISLLALGLGWMLKRNRRSDQ